MNLPQSSSLNASKAPTYSGFFEVWIVQKWTDTRLRKNVYFNSERGCFYAFSEGDNKSKFYGPANGLEVVGYLDNWQIKLTNPQSIVMETIHPMFQSPVAKRVNNLLSLPQVA